MGIDGGWHSGLLSHTDGKLAQHIKEGWYISNKAGAPWAYQVRPETIGQFIGLRDRENKEVFSGDRIRIYWTTLDDFTEENICYDSKYCYYKYGNNPLCELFDPIIQFEVVGNIYEPPKQNP